MNLPPPACSAWWSPGLVSGDSHLLLPCSTPLVISPAPVKVCVVIPCPETHLPSCHFIILVILWLSSFFPHTSSSSAGSFSRWEEGQDNTQNVGWKWWLLFFSFCYSTSYQASVLTVSFSPSSHNDLEQRICFNFSFLPRVSISPPELTLLQW